MLERFLLAIDRRPRACQAVLAALLVAAACFLPQLKFDDSPERWLPEGTHQAWKEFERHFNFGDSIAVGIAYQRPIRDDDVEPLAALREKLAAIAGMRQVYDVSLLAKDIEAVPLTQLINPANADQFGLYEGALWSQPQPGQPGQTLLTACELEYPQHDLAQLDRIRRHVMREMQIVLADAEKQPAFRDVKFHVAGGILLMDELERRARSSTQLFLPASIVVGMVSLLIGFRSWRALLLAALGSLTAMLLVLGCLGAFNAGLGVMTMSVPPLISIIAIATTVHFVSYVAETGDTNVLPGRREELIRWVAVPCLCAALTMAVGFLMLAFNQLGPVRALGFEAFAGSILAFFAVFVISQLLPIRRAYAGRFLLPEHFGRWSDWIGSRPRLGTGLLAGLMLALALCAYPWSATSQVGLKVDVDPFSFFGPEQPITQARNHFSENRFGLYQLEVVLIPKDRGRAPLGGDAGDATYQRNAAAVQAFSDKIAARGDLGVLRVISTAAFQKRQQAFFADLQKLREEQGLAAVAMKLFTMRQVAGHLQKFNETFQNWNTDKANQGTIRLTFLAHDRMPGGFGPLLALAEQSLPAGFDCYIAGNIASVVHLSSGMLSGMALGLGISAVVILATCGLMFRSLRLAAIAFLPNAFPIVMVYGFMGLVQIPLSSGSAMVATVALGIALNDTIHFILHYQKLTRERGESIEVALRETFMHIGRPIILTSAVFISGFMIFLLSDFLPLYHFGLLASIAMVAALIGDTVLLPCLLRTFDRLPVPATAASDAPAAEPVAT